MDPIFFLRRITGLTQAELAAAGGTSQPTIAAYEAGRKSPNLATLQGLAEAVGLEAQVVFHPPMVREERRSLVLHAAIARRLLREPESVVERARRNLVLMRGRHPSAGPLLREWEVLLSRPVADLATALTDPSPRMRELRQVTPFAGVLTARERAKVYRRFAKDESRR